MATQQFEDPKIVLTIKIIEAQEDVSFLLNNGFVSKAAKEIATLLLRLNIQPEEKEMEKLKKTLTPETFHVLSEQDVFKAYAEVNEFLNRTYFADYHRAKPREGTGRL